jgi:hypothetical protein
MVERKKYEVDINKFRRAIRHCIEESLMITAKSYAWKLLGKLKPCEDLLLEKQRRRKLMNSGYK